MRTPALALVFFSLTGVGICEGPTPVPSPKWVKEPTTYREIPFGAPLDDAKKKLKCFEYKASASERSCSGGFTAGSVYISDSLFFVDGKFVGVAVEFEAKAYQDVKDIFLEKYGPPSSTEHRTLTNAFGATFDQETLGWYGPGATAMLSRFGEKLDKGFAMLSSQAYIERNWAEAQEKKKKAVKAF